MRSIWRSPALWRMIPTSWFSAKMSASMAASSARPPACSSASASSAFSTRRYRKLLISGLCVGMAAQGLRPVGEIQFMGFLYPCIDQLVNHASRLRNRTQGRLSCPMVLRTPHGAGIRAPEHHSEATEAMLAHIPGLRVVIPSSPERAYGLLLAAIRDPDPVVFLEPTRIYRAVKRPGGGHRRGLAAGRCLRCSRGPRRDARQLGSDGQGHAWKPPMNWPPTASTPK